MSSDGDGQLFVIAAPSGGGKTSLINALLAQDDRLSLSISHTTRKPRPREADGQQYHFISPEAFRQLVDENAFLEHAVVFGHCYGTHAGALKEQLEQGKDVILEIDWQGAAQVRRVFPGCCSIFILPPSVEALQMRLSKRAQDSAEVIASRMQEARTEISHWAEFDYLVVNKDFDAAVLDLQSIIRARRLRRSCQQKTYASLLAELLDSG